MGLLVIASGQTLQNEQAKYEPCELACVGVYAEAGLEGKDGRHIKLRTY